MPDDEMLRELRKANRWLGHIFWMLFVVFTVVMQLRCYGSMSK